jgi:hypothetical protein
LEFYIKMSDTTISDIEKTTLKIEASFERMIRHYESITPMKIKNIELLRSQDGKPVVLCFTEYDKESNCYIKNEDGDTL